nr:hypothetical protein MACL_00003025 [Theileria orientalis]
MAQISIHSRERLGNLFMLVATSVGSLSVDAFSVYQLIYLTENAHKQWQHCYLYAGFICVGMASIVLYNSYKCYKHYSCAPEDSNIFTNLGIVGVATLILLCFYLGFKIFPNERLKLESEPFLSGDLNKLIEQKLFIIQMMLIMATILGWAMVRAEVFTGVKETGKVHVLLFLTYFIDTLPLAVQYHPDYDIQDGFFVLALLNAACVILTVLLLTTGHNSSTVFPRIQSVPPSRYNTYSMISVIGELGGTSGEGGAVYLLAQVALVQGRTKERLFYPGYPLYSYQRMITRMSCTGARQRYSKRCPSLYETKCLLTILEV